MHLNLLTEGWMYSKFNSRVSVTSLVICTLRSDHWQRASKLSTSPVSALLVKNTNKVSISCIIHVARKRTPRVGRWGGTPRARHSEKNRRGRNGGLELLEDWVREWMNESVPIASSPCHCLFGQVATVTRATDIERESERKKRGYKKDKSYICLICKLGNFPS